MSETLPRDAVVAGGGLAGGLAALALARLGLSVTLVEARAPAARGGSDGRSISLSLASLRVLEALGIGEALAAVSQPITSVHISEAGHFGRLRFSAREMGVPVLGRVVPAEPLLAGIMEAALEAGVQRLSPATVEAAPLAADGTTRTVMVNGADTTESVPTKLLLVADGGGSALRGALGIEHREHRYKSVALVTTARATHPQPGVAYERFTPQGTLAILPRAGDRVGVVWTVPEADAATLAELPAEDFLTRVADAMGGRLGTLHPVAAVRHFPLSASHALTQTTARAIVIGNAAHSLHPVAAQGFNLSVRDIAVLAECLNDARTDVGDSAALARYAERRRRDQARTRGYTDFVRNLGDLTAAPAAPARALGLLTTEFTRPLARALARQGMGLAPRPLPAWIRGVRW
ncbi:MAG: FAD-dependent monooxygenase [Gammaproteobacteria bacterium]